ncbi:hypothetical protein MWN27_12465 [Escherichia coli]|nr:hypothetical protein MWN27_12465 [Escherichia coli]
MGHPTRAPRRIRSAAGIKKLPGGSLLDKFDGYVTAQLAGVNFTPLSLVDP